MRMTRRLILGGMTDWLIFVGFLMIASAAWRLDVRAARAAVEARLEAFKADERRDAGVEPDAVRQLDPMTLSRLDGKSSPKLRAVARLVAEGALHRSSADAVSPERWRAGGPLPKGLDEYERELLEASGGEHGCYLYDLPDGPHLQAGVVTWMLDEGYVREPGQPLPDARRRRGWWSTAAAAAAVGVAVVLALDHAWVRAGLVLVFGLVSLGVASDSGAVHAPTLPVVTGKGELALRLAREHYAELDPRARNASKAYDPATVPMAVALFGWPVVKHIDKRILDDLRKLDYYTDTPGAF